MLYEFLKDNKVQILNMTEEKSLELAGARPGSVQLRKGLPIFFQQLIDVLMTEEDKPDAKDRNPHEMQKAASQSNEPAMAHASGRPSDAPLAISAGKHGQELMRLGYTLSHVVHAYGAMCQSITQLAIHKKVMINTEEFRDLNRCLDIAIAGAVTEFQSHQDTQNKAREVEHLGFLAHELRNALMSVTVSFNMMKNGSVGMKGNTGRILENGLNRMRKLIDESLTEVRLRVDPKVHPEKVGLLHLVNQINTTAEFEANIKSIIIDTTIDPEMFIQVDQQLLYSALSNLIQNAIKYSHHNSRIQIRSFIKDEEITIEVEDECGGLNDLTVDLFRPFEQQNENKKGLGLGLTIAQKAIRLNNGSIQVKNLPGKGCIFQIVLPVKL